MLWRLAPVLASRGLCIALPALLLAGCQGMYLHQPERATTAAMAKERISSIDIAALSTAENQNLDKLTREEIKSIEARQKLVSSLAVSRFSADRESIQAHYVKNMAKVSATLGISSMLDVKAVGDCKIEFAGRQDRIMAMAGILKGYDATAPACVVSGMPGILALPSGLDPSLVSDFTLTYASYKKDCEANRCVGLDPGNEMASASVERAARNARQVALKAEVEQARKDYGTAVQANQAKTKAAADKEKAVRDKAAKLVESLGKLSKVSEETGRRVQASALVELLTAAATGKADTKDPDHAAALEIAKGLPSLAQSVEAAEAADGQVPVSHMLLALNNLLVQADRDAKLAALDAEDFAALERKAAARERQAALWRLYSDNLCNLAYNANKEQGPGQACDTIRFSSPGKCDIKLADGRTRSIDNCVLTRSWRSLFEDGLPAAMPGASAQQLAAARLSLNEAAAAYLQVRHTAYQATIEELKRIDVGYRRTVVQREAALLQWKNLVALPAEELDGYYAAGVKPEEMSDVILKALAVTAVLIGVSK